MDRGKLWRLMWSSFFQERDFFTFFTYPGLEDSGALESKPRAIPEYFPSVKSLTMLPNIEIAWPRLQQSTAGARSCNPPHWAPFFLFFQFPYWFPAVIFYKVFIVCKDIFWNLCNATHNLHANGSPSMPSEACCWANLRTSQNFFHLKTTL